MNAYITNATAYIPSFNGARAELAAKVAGTAKVSEQTAENIIGMVMAKAMVSTKKGVTRNVRISRKELSAILVELGATKTGDTANPTYTLAVRWDALCKEYVFSPGGNEAKGVSPMSLLPSEEFDALMGTGASSSGDTPA